MQEFNISPVEWEELHRWDKYALSYYITVKAYKEHKQHEQYKKKAELEQNKQNVKSRLPKMRKPGRG